jgi:hypothetical protein
MHVARLSTSKFHHWNRRSATDYAIGWTYQTALETSGFWIRQKSQHSCANRDGLHPQILPVNIQSMGVQDCFHTLDRALRAPRNLSANHLL